MGAYTQQAMQMGAYPQEAEAGFMGAYPQQANAFAAGLTCVIETDKHNYD